MTNMTGTSISFEFERIEAMNTFFRKVYHWMTAGLIITAIAAHVVASSPSLLQAVFSSNLFMVFIIAELGLVFGISAGINRISAATASVLFIVYSLLNGVTLSFVLIAYTRASVFSTFLTTAGMFGVMSVYGLYTKKDLTSWGSFLMMGLFGLIIASLVNIFMKSTMTEMAISAIGVLIFMALTAWDTQKLRNIGSSFTTESGEVVHKMAIIGALQLYLDFVNIFLYLLRFFGRRN